MSAQLSLFAQRTRTARLSPVRRELARRSTAKARVLERLRQGPATNLELAEPAIGGLRAAARWAELRSEGYAITVERVDAQAGALWIVTLKGEPS